MDVNANNEREAREGEEVIFIDTGLLQKAAQGLQRAKEDFRALLDRAESGDSSAWCDLAVRYSEGDGVEKDMEAAVRWFTKAAENDDLRAVTMLGRCYQSGSGIEKDEARAVELYRRAADEGYVPALCDLGLCYENAGGVEEDKARADEI